MAFKYSLQCDTLPWVGYNLLEEPDVVLQAAAEAGYDGVDLPGNPEKMDGRAWRQRVEEAGLVVPEVLAAWGYYHAGEERNLASSDPETRGRAVQYARDTVDLAADAGASFTQLCAAQPAVPQLPFPLEPVERLRDNFRQSIREVCEHAAGRGITILLEPLNTYEGLPGVLTTIYEAVNYVDELGLDLGVQPDVYHMNVEEGSIPDALRYAGKRIRHFHLNETNHCQHGTGHADYPGDLPHPQGDRLRRVPVHLHAQDHPGRSCRARRAIPTCRREPPPEVGSAPTWPRFSGACSDSSGKPSAPSTSPASSTRRAAGGADLRGGRDRCPVILPRWSIRRSFCAMPRGCASACRGTATCSFHGWSMRAGPLRSSGTSWPSCGSGSSSRRTAPPTRCGAEGRSRPRGSTWPCTTASSRLESFRELATSPEVVALLEAVCAGPVQVWEQQLIRIVYPDPEAEAAQGVGAHQDGDPKLGYRAGRFYTCWISLMEIDAAVGGLAVAPGSHRLGLLAVRRHRRLLLRQAAGPPGRVRPRPFRAVLGDGDFVPGSAVLFHCRTAHRGLPNRSDRIRLSCDFRYQPAEDSASWLAPHPRAGGAAHGAADRPRCSRAGRSGSRPGRNRS